jgi:NADP-dependent 3-hydroxy acid dehydrogenase YdfG
MELPAKDTALVSGAASGIGRLHTINIYFIPR